MVRDRAAELLRLPEVPWTVTAKLPMVAFCVAVSVSTLEVVVGFAEKLAVTPLGSPVTEMLTLPVNPPTGTTDTVVVALPRRATDAVAGERDRVKPGAGLTVRITDPVAVV